MSKRLRVLIGVFIVVLVVLAIVVINPGAQEGRFMKKDSQQSLVRGVSRLLKEKVARRAAPKPPKEEESVSEVPVPPSPPEPSEQEEAVPIQPTPSEPRESMDEASTPELSTSTFSGSGVVLTISVGADTPHSQILTPHTESTSSVTLAKFRYTTTEAVRLERLTFVVQPEPSTGLTVGQAANNFGNVYLVQEENGEVLATGFLNPNGEVTFIQSGGILLSANTVRTLLISAQIAGTGALTPVSNITSGSIVRVAVYSDDSDRAKLRVRHVDTDTLLNDNNIALTDAVDSVIPTGQYMMIRQSEPIVTKMLGETIELSTQNRMLKFSIQNSGMAPIDIRRISIDVLATGLGASREVTNWQLWRGDMVQLVAGTSSMITAEDSTKTIIFQFQSSGTSSGGVWREMTPFIIPAGETQTFTVTADTRGVLTNLSTGQNVVIRTSILGAKGYAAGDTIAEDAWANSAIYYRLDGISGYEMERGCDSDDISAALTFVR